ncbi:MAG: hypothetical protein ACN6OP_18555 [Pseudomonadales bacterium]
MLYDPNKRFELPVDLDLSDEVRIQVYSLSAEIYATKKRLARDVVAMCISLHQLKGIMGDAFEEYSCQSLGFARGSLWRYLKVGSSCMAATKGMNDPSELINATTMRAFQLLDGASEELLSAVRERALRGEPINEPLVKDLMKTTERLEQDLANAEDDIRRKDAEIQAKDAEIEAHGQQRADIEREMKGTIEKLESKITAIQYEEMQTANIATERQRLADMLAEDVVRLEAKIRSLQAEAEHAKVIERVVERSPDDQRIAADELQRINQQISDAKQRLNDTESTLRQMAEDLARARADDETVRNLRSDFQAFFGKLSTTLLLKTSQLSVDSREALSEMAEALSTVLPTLQRYGNKEAA